MLYVPWKNYRLGRNCWRKEDKLEILSWELLILVIKKIREKCSLGNLGFNLMDWQFKEGTIRTERGVMEEIKEKVVRRRTLNDILIVNLILYL